MYVLTEFYAKKGKARSQEFYLTNKDVKGYILTAEEDPMVESYTVGRVFGGSEKGNEDELYVTPVQPCEIFGAATISKMGGFAKWGGVSREE